ncbi:MAG: DUF547 domain-containing protein [Kiritimatiellae bacterium]|nr:DUF547 domain-containing protein [Kiritimatiellia bacterium]MDW8458107.1 DUF547 domain-containing protein [Verrucomicrobiota bacterium]
MIQRAILTCLLAALTGCQTPTETVQLNRDIEAEEEGVAALRRASLGPDTAGAKFDHKKWGDLLSAGVRSDGLVDYAALKRRETQLDEYLVEAGDVPLASLSRHEQLALLLNLFNACTVKMILEHPGVQSVTDIRADASWKHKGWVVDRRGVSLQEIERAYIRTRFPDPRIHFALVRGARGSPPLRAEPYTGAQLEAQLNDQARRVLADPRFARWDAARNRLILGGFFGRYRRDFADTDAELVRVLLPWFPEEIRRALAGRDRIDLEFAPFDWRLNGSW